MTLCRFMKSQFLKKLAKLLLSVSVFFFFFSFSSSLSCFFTSSFQLFTHTVDRKCMFFLCNGILVFLSRSSGLDGLTSSASDHSYEYLERNTIPSQLLGSSEEVVVQDTGSAEKVAIEEGRESVCLVKRGERETEKYKTEDEEGETQSGFVMVTEENRKEELGSIVFIEEEEEEEGNTLLSTEDLNKKFEDFIRKMKEEIRVGAQQQLLVV